MARALAKKIMSYDSLCINFEDKKRKDGTWCMWLTWKDMTRKTTGYSLVSENANSSRHEDAAKSFEEDFLGVELIDEEGQKENKARLSYKAS